MSLPEPIWANPEQVEMLHKVLGHALLRFQYVETAMFQIGHCLMGTEYEVSSLIFFHSKSAENKLSLLDRLLKYKLKQHSITKHWIPIKKEIEDIIEFRNVLAHFEIIWTIRSEMKPPSAYNYAISDHHLNEFARRSGNIRGLSIESIEKYSQKTRELSYKLIYFLFDYVPSSQQGIATLPAETRAHLHSLRVEARPAGF